MTKIRRKLNLLSKKEKEEINKRIELCIDCPFNSVNAVEKGLYTTERIDLHCMHCGCELDLHAHCLDCNCSIEIYNEKNNLNIPLRWHKI